MKTRNSIILAVLLAMAMGAHAAVTIDVGNNADGTNRLWTVSNLGASPPTVAGDNNPGITGFLSAASELAPDAQFTLNFTAATTWDSAAAQAALAGGTFGAYIAGLVPGIVNGGNSAFGVESGIGDTQPNRFNMDGEAMLIELGTTNLTTFGLVLELFGWTLDTANDRADILIYHAASNTVTEIQWNARPSNMPAGSYGIDAGDIMVVGVGLSNALNEFRWKSMTLDIPSEATGVVPPVGLTAFGRYQEVQLDWVSDPSGELDYYNIYRSTTSGTNYALLATGITTNTYTDTMVVNDTPYFYVATAVDTNLLETDPSFEVSATPTPWLTIENLTDNQQGATRTTNDVATGTYLSNGFNTVVGNLKAGETGNKPESVFELGRPVIKFPLTASDLAGNQPRHIERVLLRLYLNSNALDNGPTNTLVEVYAAPTEAANAGIVANDFENTAYTRLGTWTGITANSPDGTWYEFDVTETVLADLANDAQDGTAGSCFRLQLTDDTSLVSTDNPDGGGIVGAVFDDNSDPNIPQLRIEFASGVPQLVDIQVDPIPEPDQVVVGWKGSSNLTYRVSAAMDLTTGIWDLLATNLPGVTPVTYYTTDVLGVMGMYQVEAVVPTVPLDEDFESGPNGWTRSAAGAGTTEWDLGTPSVSTVFFTLTGAASGINCYGTSLSDAYQQGTDITLSSPTVDLAGVSSATLSWNESVDISATDQGQVLLVDFDAATTTTLHTSSGTVEAWNEVFVPIPASSIGHEVQVQFRLLDDNVADAFYYGWYIDDVKVTPDI